MAKTKKPLITKGDPAPETPYGQSYYQQFFPLDGSLTREELRRQIKVPLYASILLNESRGTPIEDKKQLKTVIRNFIIQWAHVITDPTKLAGNAMNIGTQLINNIVNRLPRYLTYDNGGRDFVLNALNCQYHGPAYVDELKALYYLLENLHSTLDEDIARVRVVQGGIDDNNREKSEAQERADKLVKEQGHIEKARASVEEGIEEDPAGGIGL